MSARPHVGAWQPPPPSSASAASSRGVQGFHHGASMGFVTGASGGFKKRPSAALSGHHQWPSSSEPLSSVAVISGRHQWPSSVVFISGPSSVTIKGYQRSSEVIRGHQRSSEEIRGTQRNSVALVPAVSPRTPMVDVREGQARCPLVTAMPARPAGTWRTRAARHRAVRSPHLRPPDEEGNRRATRWTIWSSSNSNP